MSGPPATNGRKPKVIGIYGLQGVGKTHLISHLQDTMDDQDFTFYDGSKMINQVVPEHLKPFQALPGDQKAHWRSETIKAISRECGESGKAGVVAGHAMLGIKNIADLEWVMTEADFKTYTHIVYLEKSASVIKRQRASDERRGREDVSEDRLTRWQTEETTRLREECRKHGILYSTCCPRQIQQRVLNVLDGGEDGGPLLSGHIQKLLTDFRNHDEDVNQARAELRLAEIIGSRDLEVLLAIDGDKTLAAEDTGLLFWKTAANLGKSSHQGDPLKALFSSGLKYGYTAFRQATLLYEDMAFGIGEGEFHQLCHMVADVVNVRPQFQHLLEQANVHVGAVVLTSGNGLIWQKILAKAGLAEKVQVIGGGRIVDGFVVTPDVKAALVDRLQKHHRLRVWAFGDSPLDIHMLAKADRAVVVVGREENRSKTMEMTLMEEIGAGRLKAQQVLVPSDTTPRLDWTKLPLTDFAEIGAAINSPFLIHATEKSAAKLLMGPTRDATKTGQVLQEAHTSVGWYLATEFLADVVGLEEHTIMHVQRGKTFISHRLRDEGRTLIVALMRGGLYIAQGVFNALTFASLHCCKIPEELTNAHLAGLSTVVLADAVVNNGETVKKFVEHIRELDTNVRIVVVAGVVQCGSVINGSPLRSLARKHGKLTVITLRLSVNKYTGKGTTDTGNRLFNTTHLLG